MSLRRTAADAEQPVVAASIVNFLGTKGS